MLQRIRIKNFKLLRDVELEFPAEVPTVLIGANSSGKSTVIEVIDFLARCANDGLEAAVNAHGGMSAVRTIGAYEAIEIGTVWTIGADELAWTLRFNARPNGAVVVEAEEMSRNGLPIIAMNAGARQVIDELDRSSTTTVDDPRRLAFEVFLDPKRYFGLGILMVVIGGIHVIGALATTPPWARAARDRVTARDAVIISTDDAVGPEGIGLATALYNLQVNHVEAWRRLERAFQGEFPFVKRILFPPDPGGSRISFAIEDARFHGRSVYASEMSDGMVAFLCLLSLILHPGDVGTLALDEPDTHLHPSAIRSLIGIAHEPSRWRRTLVIATHSNAVIDELQHPAESIRIVDSTPDGARIRKLDAEALAAWRKEYTMSELRQTGLLDPSNRSYGSDA